MDRELMEIAYNACQEFIANNGDCDEENEEVYEKAEEFIQAVENLGYAF